MTGQPETNSTEFTTKSGTKVIVLGKPSASDRRARDAAGDYFVDVYNRNFTAEEQRGIGNILYDFHNTHPDTSRGTKNVAATTGTFAGEEARRYNPGRRKMVDLQFRDDYRRNEGTITHELIHAKKFMAGIKGNHHNEKKIDFESLGRVSRHGVIGFRNGYYFGESPLTRKLKKRGCNHKKIHNYIVKKGVYADRRLLTGSISKSIIGRTAGRRAESLFPKSFFFKKSFR